MSSFPASKYSRYKRATAFFLDWLLRARGRGRHAGSRVQLETFSLVVEEIAADPSILTPKLLQELPKALAACQCAITFRQHVASFFADAEGGHQHFLELLRTWFINLKRVVTEQQQAAVESESSKFENYYQVLEVDEDYFPDTEILLKEKGASKRAKEERERVFNEAFATDLKLEVLDFFYELEELVEEVFRVYEQVKSGERTMVEAAVVVKLAMDMANAKAATLQLQYPAFETAEDVIALIENLSPKKFSELMVICADEVRGQFERDGKCCFVPHIFISEFVSVVISLHNLALIFPENYSHDVNTNSTTLGASYREEYTPEYMLLDANKPVTFLVQQLPVIYNTLRANKMSTGLAYDRKSLTGSFMAVMEKYFDSRKVTVPVVFACICWMKSVAALQGNAGLSRNIALSFKHSRELVRIMETTVAKCAVLASDQKLHEFIKAYAAKVKSTSRGHCAARVNPLMAGFMMVDNIYYFLFIASTAILTTQMFRAFGHLYNALVGQEYLDRIPFFENILNLYAPMIFTPSRTAAIRGAYHRTYLLSLGASVNLAYQGTGRDWGKYRKDLRPVESSKIFRFLDENDTSFLKGSSSRDILNTATDTCAKELFETRVLSLDMMTLNDDLTDVFSELCDVLGRRQFHDDHIAGSSSSGNYHQAGNNSALEHAVMMPLMPLLDCVQPDGSVDLSALPADLQRGIIGRIDGGYVRKMGMKVATVIKAKFSTPPLVCENKYFTFPSQPDFANQEYGSTQFKGKTTNDNRERVFSELLDLLKNSDGPLNGDNLNYLKSEIKKDPELLAMVSSRNAADMDLDYVADASGDDLCTLLHQAAAGPAHDIDLVEWMIQLGALTMQPRPDVSASGDARAPSIHVLTNTLAVHSAASAGHAEIVQLLLEADSMVDLNTPTFLTKETLAHLAVKHGHRRVLETLCLFKVDICAKDGNGRRVCDVTADREWARKIALTIVKIEQGRAKAKQRATPRNFHQSFCAEQPHKLVVAQRDEERRLAFEKLSVNGGVGSKKKKNRKGKRGKRSADGH
ncbi:hypothetical protein PF008_g19422 [Phytophthora fragariae]|uniref:DUF6604 domain-containing protein n=1 Tax=Phytophthora fragariae TaxID=53985 RepID=A0A6G0R2Q2_9STRA|nr:hypothetical protein PF008_g19422 [Phytophthora fragariae]